MCLPIQSRRIPHNPEEVNVTIRPKKSSVGFPGVKMLGNFVGWFWPFFLGRTHRSNSQHCRTYLTSLAALEHFLGVMGYLRDKGPRYSQIVNPLQKLKTSPVKDAPVAGQQHKSYVNRTYQVVCGQRRKYISPPLEPSTYSLSWA